MTNEEIVLKKLEKKAKSPLRFKVEWFDYYYEFDEKVKDLKSTKSIEDRIFKIMKLNNYAHTYNGSRHQANKQTNRSAQDIWRIYRYYFGDIDIFTIMRSLYSLASSKKLSTYLCPTVRKQVFWITEPPVNAFHKFEKHNKADLGVPIIYWENIGLNKGEINES